MHDVSVIIPCFNAGNYLEQCVRSAIGQKGAVLIREIIVVDDRSDDPETRAALARLTSFDRVKVVSNPGTQGSAAARNEGVRLAQSEWIAFLDADDWWPDDSLSRRFAALDVFPDAEWIGGDFIELNRDGKWESRGRFERNIETYEALAPGYHNGRRTIRLDFPLECFLKQAPTHTIVSLLSKSLFERVGGFNEHLLRQQDFHLFLRLARQASFVYVPHVVAFYRLHESNSTKSLTETQEWRIRAISDLHSDPCFVEVRKVLRDKIFNLYLSNSYQFRAERRFADATLAAWKAIKNAPRAPRGWRSLAASLLHLQ